MKVFAAPEFHKFIFVDKHQGASYGWVRCDDCWHRSQKKIKEPLHWAAPAFNLPVMLIKNIQVYKQRLIESGQTIRRYIPAYIFMDILSVNLSSLL